jgi:hypothetical protein
MISAYAKLARTIYDLSVASPQVLAARTMRTYQPSSARDQVELLRMITEKQAAAVESWVTLVTAAPIFYQRLMFDFWSSAFPGNRSNGFSSSSRIALKAAQRAVKPYQRRASANARRLSR